MKIKVVWDGFLIKDQIIFNLIKNKSQIQKTEWKRRRKPKKDKEEEGKKKALALFFYYRYYYNAI